ncbi:MAG: M2 family metallopeptidase [Planctomycetia bacterium]|nr:M2 family metallopeptidase [Planctomycetia bacterium]
MKLTRRDFTKQTLATTLAGGVVSTTVPPTRAASDDSGDTDTMATARKLLDHYDTVIRPQLYRVYCGEWDSSVTGKDEDYARKVGEEKKLAELFSDPVTFAKLKEVAAAKPADPLVARQIELMLCQYTSYQGRQETIHRITDLSSAIAQKFNVFRAIVDGKEMSDNEVREILIRSDSSEQREKAWKASKVVGETIEGDLTELVAARNQLAQELGFRTYWEMSLQLDEQNGDEIIRLFDELDTLTRPLFQEVKAKVDAAMAAKCGVNVRELMPWNYQDPFFQETPTISGNDYDFDGVYRDIDCAEICRNFYAGIGLPVDSILERSSLYEQPGKCPHAFCIDMDREGDVRILCNIVPSERWLSTTLHELGHGVYGSTFIPEMPFLVRDAAHTFVTEGVAMMFERFGRCADWLEAMGVPVTDKAGYNATVEPMRRAGLLVFSRWCQVMVRFEKAMYEDPTQNLSRLWWDLVEEYQELRRPEELRPDYAAKYHISCAPCYYHNYELGEMYSSQLRRAIFEAVVPGVDSRSGHYVGKREAGQIMIDQVFAHGRKLRWDAMVKASTGRELSAEAFADDLR